MVFCISAAAFVSCGNKQEPPPAAVKDELVRYPEKKDMYLLTDRPPQLETPLKIFKEDFTPNEYFFVRWHMSQILTKIDIDSFRLYISGAVGKPLAISMADLKNKYPADTIAALCICAGNSRSTFTPRVPGSQWRSGGMGNAAWKGVKLKYLLEAAGIKKNAIDISFCGMDRAPLPETPVFTKSLSVSHAMDGDVLVAYTDGITEAVSPSGSMFGIERLCSEVQKNHKLPAENIRNAVIASVREFMGGRPALDDISLLVIKPA